MSEDLHNNAEVESGNVWRNLIAALTLSGDVNPDIQDFQLGMVFVRHDAASFERRSHDGGVLSAGQHSESAKPGEDGTLEISDEETADVDSELCFWK